MDNNEKLDQEFTDALARGVAKLAQKSSGRIRASAYTFSECQRLGSAEVNKRQLDELFPSSDKS